MSPKGEERWLWERTRDTQKLSINAEHLYEDPPESGILVPLWLVHALFNDTLILLHIQPTSR